MKRAIAFLLRHGIPPPEAIIPISGGTSGQFPDIAELWSGSTPPAFEDGAAKG
jgi:hypothetical protein